MMNMMLACTLFVEPIFSDGHTAFTIGGGHGNDSALH